jgi:outer membrane protein assembly factor BamB
MGDRWILVPASAGPSAQGFQSNGAITAGAIAAWKVDLKDGVPKLQPGWISRDMVSPLPPIVVNDVIFALSAGKPGSSNAVLYALDPATGKELWSSGSTIVSYANGGGLAAGGTRVYVATHDGIQYAFGFPIEH